MLYKASCHCGDIQLEVEAPEHLEVVECNCSICAKTGLLHIIVPKSRFRLLSDWAKLGNYQFNTGVAQHYFCKRCGIRPFYLPRSNPDGYVINARCLDTAPLSITVEPFDGQNWELHAEKLLCRSKDDATSAEMFLSQ